MRLKVSSAKRRPFCLRLNVLNRHHLHTNVRYRHQLCDYDYTWLALFLYRHILMEVVSDVALSNEWHHRPQQCLIWGAPICHDTSCLIFNWLHSTWWRFNAIGFLLPVWESPFYDKVDSRQWNNNSSPPSTKPIPEPILPYCQLDP